MAQDGTNGVIEAPVLKRAQILVSDLAGAFAESSDLVLGDREQLTAFADYKVPQVLRHLGMLRYADSLATTIHDRIQIAADSQEEIEIRAATIWGCELVRQHLVTRGGSFTAADVDWLLWNAGQHLPPSCEPYHRTVTVFY